MIPMEPTDVNADADQQDLFHDLPVLESITSCQGIFPDFLFFWRRRQRKPADTS